MLTVDFLNVGDGDSILLQCGEGGNPRFTALVDTGRPYLEPVNRSLRASALDSLLRRGIDHIDLLILTHLHIDHIGGTREILNSIPVRQMTALYIPGEEPRRVMQIPEDREKSIRGLGMTLNVYAEILQAAKAAGTALVRAEEGALELCPGLTMELFCPDEELRSRQAAVFDALYRGEYPGDDLVYRVSKERNNTSLITRFTYGGRRVLLTGDSYASYWQSRNLGHCDLLKLPHHGDAKSMTEELLSELSPAFAVVSCENTVPYSKERPAQAVIDMIRRAGTTTVFCTENRDMETLPFSTSNGIRAEIETNGALTCRPLT